MNVHIPSKDTLYYIFLCFGLIGALYGAFKIIKPIMKNWYINNVLKPVINDCVKPIENKLDQIYNQLTVNGGNLTVKDDLTNMRTSINILRAENRAQIALSDTPTFINDETGACVFVNDSICDMFGATKDEMLGYGWVNFLLDSEKKQKAENFERGLRSDTYIKDSYHVINGVTGEQIQCEYLATVTRDKYGKPVSVIGTVKRIS